MLFSKPKGDLQKFFDSLTQVKVNRNNYTKADRFRDFQQVFSSEEGRRVLAQIISEAEGWPISDKELDHAKLCFRMGKRELGLWIVKVLQAQPLEDTNHD